jgi:hypothetical protein
LIRHEKEMLMRKKRKPHHTQPNLFQSPVVTPPWQLLPLEVRQRLRVLLVGLQTGRGNRWTKERVTSLRKYHRINCYSRENKESEGWMTLAEAAEFLQLSSRTVRLAVERGEIKGEHPLTDGPWVFRRCDLETPEARELVHRAQKHNRHRAVPDAAQEEFVFSRT